jgi:ALG3 protein
MTLEELYIQLASSQPWDTLFTCGILAAECLLGILIIQKVAYTEIDWEAYMQEVSMWWDDGIYDYRNIYGGTGPLVYPAGFLYLFLGLRWITHQGTNVKLAQYLFLGMYLGLQALLVTVYTRCARFLASTIKEKDTQQLSLQKAHTIWSWRIAMGLCCCSKRLHSIFMLRLFNEGPTMVLLWVCLYFLINNHWNSGCVAFSYAVSIKMNVLLFAPGLLLLLIQQARGDLKLVVKRLFACCALPQLVLGAPFLMTYPESYLRKAFELDRVFFFKWTVNWKVRNFCLGPLIVGILLFSLVAYITFPFLYDTSSFRKIFLFPNRWPFYYWHAISVLWRTWPFNGFKLLNSNNQKLSTHHSHPNISAIPCLWPISWALHLPGHFIINSMPGIFPVYRSCYGAGPCIHCR